MLEVPTPFDAPTELHWETADTAWVRPHELAEMELFPAFRVTLGHLGLL